jgi:hypothetical protein
MQTSHAVQTLPASLPLILVDDVQGAALFCVCERTFQQLQKESWFPTPRMLGPRTKRHVYAELVEATSRMPRCIAHPEPAQLVRSRVHRIASRERAPSDGHV